MSISCAARLDNTYLPPASAGGAGGGPGLSTPFGPGGKGPGGFGKYYSGQIIIVQIVTEPSVGVYAV